MPETPDPEPVQQAQPSRKASQVKTYEFTSELETGNELIDSELRYYKEQFSLREIIDMVA